MRGSDRQSLLLLAAALTCSHARAASFPPELRFRTLRTDRVSVHFHDTLEVMARRAAPLAAAILERHEARYGVRVGRVHVVLEDTRDGPNAFATPFPYPIVRIQAAAPNGSDEFGNHDGWLRLVLTHELAHVVHVEPARGIFGWGRKLLGRARFLFPNWNTPTWMTEGLATYEETQGTTFGRGRNPDSRMVLRLAALEGRFLREDQAVAGLDEWPAGQASYLFGEAFLRNLLDRRDASTLRDLTRVHAEIPFRGAPFHARWLEWAKASKGAFELEAEDRRSDGLSQSRLLTRRGIRQTAPRFSPDGRRIAYTSVTLDRHGEIRLLRANGEDRRLTVRNGGTALAWATDGRTIVYDEPDTHRLFRTLSDLRAVDVATGRTRRITRGLRAQDPDVAPDGRTIVFVRRLGDRSDLHTIALDGTRLRRLTQSETETEWSGPRVSPDGQMVAASRWRKGGLLDLVLVDLESGAITPLIEDRAKDVEPSWLSDGSGIVFRSDRDGVSNLYLLRLADRRLLRLTNVLGGAFTPDVSSRAPRLAFASYSSRGYDLHVMDFETARLGPAPPFVDPYPRSLPGGLKAEPAEGKLEPYRPYPTALPRFWVPYLASESEGWRVGALTEGADPLQQHAYGLELRYGTGTGRAGFKSSYRYDRFLPTLLVTAQDAIEPGLRAQRRRQELAAQASVPLRRTLRSSTSLSLAWRRRRDSERGAMAAAPLDLGGLEAALTLSNARRYPYSISAVEGGRLRLAFLRELPAFGSDVSLAKVSADARGYVRAGRAVVAGRVGGGMTLGRPSFTRSFAIGGFSDDGLRDVERTNHSVLRGYGDDAFEGRSYLAANFELRLPVAHPQRGLHSLPAFVRHLHAAAFIDFGHAWNGALRLRDFKAGVGVALGADVNLAHTLPITFTASLARAIAEPGGTRVHFRSGLSF